MKAFHTHSNKHKYCKIMHTSISTWQSEKHKYCHNNQLEKHKYCHGNQKSTKYTVNAYINTKVFHTRPLTIWLYTDTYTLPLTPHADTHAHMHTSSLWHTTHAQHTHVHSIAHTHTADEKVAAAAGSPVSPMLCSPPTHHASGDNFRDLGEGSVKEVCFEVGLKRYNERCWELGLYQNRIPHTRCLILETPCTSTFQVNKWDRESSLSEDDKRDLLGVYMESESVRGKGAMYHQSSRKPMLLICVQCTVWWEASEAYMHTTLFTKNQLSWVVLYLKLGHPIWSDTCQ